MITLWIIYLMCLVSILSHTLSCLPTPILKPPLVLRLLGLRSPALWAKFSTSLLMLFPQARSCSLLLKDGCLRLLFLLVEIK